jgi:NADP-dependent 3-hydroxy acid dehydrogenase YdfG
MLERQRGHVINLSSIAGKMAYPGGAFYCASKAAVEALTAALRAELVATPLRVTTVLSSPLFESLKSSLNSPFTKKVSRRTAHRR